MARSSLLGEADYERRPVRESSVLTSRSGLPSPLSTYSVPASARRLSAWPSDSSLYVERRPGRRELRCGSPISRMPSAGMTSMVRMDPSVGQRVESPASAGRAHTPVVLAPLGQALLDLGVLPIEASGLEPVGGLLETVRRQ